MTSVNNGPDDSLEPDKGPDLSQFFDDEGLETLERMARTEEIESQQSTEVGDKVQAIFDSGAYISYVGNNKAYVLSYGHPPDFPEDAKTLMLYSQADALFDMIKKLSRIPPMELISRFYMKHLLEEKDDDSDDA